MRVMLWTPFYEYDPKRGAATGVQAVVTTLARELHRRGHEAAILATNTSGGGVRVGRDGSGVVQLRADLPELLFPAEPAALALARQQVVDLAESWPPDVVNVHYVSWSAPLAVDLAAALHKPLVASLHGSDTHTHPYRSPMRRELLARVMGAAAAVTVPSHALREALWRLGAEVAHVSQAARVIANGVALPKPSTEGRQRSAALAPYILGVGRLTPVKGFDLLIRAFRELARDFPAHRLVIAGEGHDRAKLEDLIRADGLTERVSLLGRVSQSYLASLYTAADIFVLSSRDEGFGLVLAEAMGSGCPVLATAVGAAADLLRHDETAWLVPPQDARALSNGVRLLLTDPQRRARLASAGRKLAHGILTAEAMVDAYVQLFTEILGQQRPGRPAAGAVPLAATEASGEHVTLHVRTSVSDAEPGHHLHQVAGALVADNPPWVDVRCLPDA